ncbi:TetR/AcrR family transcriptional regulator [Glycomyces salinus]|uniref:TetR/AcrR family transcriptional regulator n=1 Tax=Glycomyces salinus TaxID=980294 RepID=UPI0018ED31C9|nr:TetR/AcrR family transcriptional regulator [Glycomyces salinus]
MTADTPTRRRGKALEQAIYQAVWDELQEVGFPKLTMEGIARRAGTSKPVLYRRWPNRKSLMIATIHHFLPGLRSLPDGGSLRADALAVLRILRERLLDVGRATILGILMESADDPRGDDELLSALVDYLKEFMEKSVFLRAVERGEIVPEQVTGRLLTLPLDLARIEFFITGDLPERSLEEIVDVAFLPALGLRPPHGTRTAG